MDNYQYIKFQFVLIEMVLKQKNDKHFLYLKIYEKLKFSNKKNKLKLSKYILSRLLRESERILAIAQKHSTENCPYKNNFKEKVISSSFNLNSIH